MPSGYALPRKRCKLHGSYPGSKQRCPKCREERRAANRIPKRLDDLQCLGLLTPFLPGAEFTYADAERIWGPGARGRANTLVHYGWLKVLSLGRFKVLSEEERREL